MDPSFRLKSFDAVHPMTVEMVLEPDGAYSGAAGTGRP